MNRPSYSSGGCVSHPLCSGGDTKSSSFFRQPPPVFFYPPASRDRSHSETKPTNADAATPRSPKELVIESTIIVRRPFGIFYLPSSTCARPRAHVRTGTEVCAYARTHEPPTPVWIVCFVRRRRPIAETKSEFQQSALIWPNASPKLRARPCFHGDLFSRSKRSLLMVH